MTGLLDLDTLGRGERLDDAACLLGHLSVLTRIHPARAGSIGALGDALWRRFGTELDSRALARRSAAVVLSLATGPHRVQEHDWPHKTGDRLELARRWVDSAGTSFVDARTMSMPSSPAPGCSHVRPRS